MEHPASVNNFRLISLRNVVYKIISKIHSSRLRPNLKKLISPLQFAFVPNRLINDNSIVVEEIFHYMKRKKGREGFMTIKYDMEKAYDQVEWSFIIKVLNCFGFSDIWCHWILQCISTVSFSVLINGCATRNIIPQRGLCQGDAMTPFLYILCTEVLSGLIVRSQ